MVFNISHVLISDLQRRRREEECSFGPRRGWVEKGKDRKEERAVRAAALLWREGAAEARPCLVGGREMIGR